MNNKKLRKISKKELLEILLVQAKKIEELENLLNEMQLKLDSKEIKITESGSLAEACLKLNDIFDTAQKTADQYIYNIKEKCKKIENETKRECQIQKDNMLKETEMLCQKREKKADEYLLKIELQVKELTKNKKQKAIPTNKLSTSEYTKIVTAKKETINNNRNIIKGRPVKKIGECKTVHEKNR